jgi:transposase
MVKTDQNDALGLARLVRSGWYRPAAVRSIETHRLRALLITRDQLVGMRTALINNIRGLAKSFGILIGLGKGGTFARQVRAQLPDDPILNSLFETLLTILSTIQDRSHEIAKQLARVARQNRICRLMMTTPGVGPITAISFVTTIEDPRRFRRSQDVGAYLGLTPRRLFEAANAMLSRISMPLASKEWGAAIGRRSGFWKARVAWARKLSAKQGQLQMPEKLALSADQFAAQGHSVVIAKTGSIPRTSAPQKSERIVPAPGRTPNRSSIVQSSCTAS